MQLKYLEYPAIKNLFRSNPKTDAIMNLINYIRENQFLNLGFIWDYLIFNLYWLIQEFIKY